MMKISNIVVGACYSLGIIMATIGTSMIVRDAVASSILPVFEQGVVLLGTALLPDKSTHAGITVKLSRNGVDQTVTTDAGGTFSFSSVPPGPGYQITAGYGKNYLKAMRGDITVKRDGLNRVGSIVLAARPGTTNGVVTTDPVELSSQVGSLDTTPT